MATIYLEVLNPLSSTLLAQVQVATDLHIKELKQELEQQTQVPAKYQQLMLDTRELKDTQTLSELELVSGATLSLVRREPAEASVKDVPENKLSDLVLMRYLLDHGKFVNSTRGDGMTILHLAAKRGHADLCRIILEQDRFMEVNALDHYGSTALHHAAENGHAQVCSVILQNERFTALNEQDGHKRWGGQTALHCAAEQGHVNVCQIILEDPQCDVHVLDKLGKSAFEYAARHGYDEVCNLFLQDCRFTKEQISQMKDKMEDPIALHGSTSHKLHVQPENQSKVVPATLTMINTNAPRDPTSIHGASCSSVPPSLRTTCLFSTPEFVNVPFAMTTANRYVARGPTLIPTVTPSPAYHYASCNQQNQFIRPI